MRWFLAVLALPVGIGAELTTGAWGSPAGFLDLLVGLALVWCGLSIQDQKWPMVLLVIAGFAWFAGNVASPLLLLHRGPLVHLLVAYPTGRPRGVPAWVVVAVGYLAAVGYPHGDWPAVVLGVALGGYALGAQVRATAPPRRVRFAGVAGATAFGAVLAVGGLCRLAGADVDEQVLLAYELGLLLVAALVLVDRRWGPWRRATVTGLAVDLGDLAPGDALQTRLAAALGDPSARLVYWSRATGGYEDIGGRPVGVPDDADENRVLTTLTHDGERLGGLVHDVSVTRDDALVADIAALAATALANARLQEAALAGLAEVEASRRRIVVAADDERRRLAEELRDGAERRLSAARDTLAGHADLRELLVAALTELDGFARGVHPRTLTESGLADALAELTRGIHLDVELDVLADRLPAEIEAAAYFVCAEAVTNTVKHAGATSVRVRVLRAGDRLCVEVVDDGVGGADPRLGSGLHGLVDRVTALGGVLEVDTAPWAGTRVFCTIPLPGDRGR